MSTGDYQIETNGITFLIPKGFDRLQANSEKDEILKLRYKDEMYIVVQDNVAGRIKESKIAKAVTMDLVHDMKFQMLKQGYNGYNETKRKSYDIGGRRVTEQEFKTKEHFGEAYYKYSIVETTNTFIEVLFSGQEELHIAQEKLSEKFIKAIDNSEIKK